MLYQLRDCTYAPGGHVILSHIDFEIKTDDRIAIVGRNGIGKTTLLRMLAGEILPDRDDRRKDTPVMMSESISIGVFSQNGSDERLSGGQQTRRRLAELFDTHPELLLLDEPTNHLDTETVEWLEAYLNGYKGAVVVVSHDRFFLDRVARTVCELSEGGILTRYPGNYSAYKKEKAAADERARKAAAIAAREMARLDELIERFKRRPRKAAMARAKRTQLERMKRIAPAPAAAPEPMRRIIPEIVGPKILWEAKDLSVGYDRKKPLYTISMKLTRGQRIGLLGRNGSGKSALLKTVAGLLSQLSGDMRTGERVVIGYFDQHAADLLAADPDYASLSGGERSKLALSRIIEAAPNLLLLDEPTNHMDIAAQESIEDMLEHYEGTVMFASHDRYFLNRIADTLIVLEKGTASFYPFGYEHYLYRREQAARAGHMPGECRGDCESPQGEITGMLSPQDMLLVEELRAVPEREKGMLRRIPVRELAQEWELARSLDACRALETKTEQAMLEYCFCGGSRQDWEDARNEWTQALLEWYDISNRLNEDSEKQV